SGPFAPNAPIPPGAINQIPDEVNLLWPTGSSGGTKAEYPYPTFGVEESRNPGAPVILAGTDTLLTDVLSCDVKVLLPNMTDFVDLFSQATSDYWTDPATSTGKNSILTGAFPGGFNNTVRVFDTWSQAADDWRDYRSYDKTTTNNTIPMFVNSSNQRSASWPSRSRCGSGTAGRNRPGRRASSPTCEVKTPLLESA